MPGKRGVGKNENTTGEGVVKPEVSGILMNLGAPDACLVALFCSLDRFHALSVHFSLEMQNWDQEELKNKAHTHSES